MHATWTVSNICSAFKPETIGSRVTDEDSFMAAAVDAINKHDFAADPVPGQGFILVPEAVPFVSAGVGPRSTSPNDYVCRQHRGVVSAYLRREFAAPVTGCALVAYTLDAYLNDPDTVKDLLEVKRIQGFEKTDPLTHVLVAVLAFAGPESPLPPYRLVWNLAGGNHEAALWSADEIRAKAKAAIDYDNEWSTVAD